MPNTPQESYELALQNTPLKALQVQYDTVYKALRKAQDDFAKASTRYKFAYNNYWYGHPDGIWRPEEWV